MPRPASATFPFQRTFAIPAVGACPLTFTGHKTFCRQQHLGGALVGQDSRSVNSRYKGTSIHEMTSDYRTPGSHVSAVPGDRIGEDSVMQHEVTLGDRRRFTVQAPWGYTHLQPADVPLPSRSTDTRIGNFQTTVLGARNAVR